MKKKIVKRPGMQQRLQKTGLFHTLIATVRTVDRADQVEDREVREKVGKIARAKLFGTIGRIKHANFRDLFVPPRVEAARLEAAFKLFVRN